MRTSAETCTVSAPPTSSSPSFLGLESQSRGFTPKAGEVELVLLLGVLLPRLPFDLALVTVELVLWDPVVGALVGDEGLILRGHGSGRELLTPGADRHVEVDLGQLVLAGALEGAGELQRDGALQLRRRGAGGLQLCAQVQVQLAAVDLLLPAERLVDELLGGLVAAARVAAARRRAPQWAQPGQETNRRRRNRRRAGKADLPFDGRRATPACLQWGVRPALAGETRVNIQNPLFPCAGLDTTVTTSRGPSSSPSWPRLARRRCCPARRRARASPTP